MDKYINIFQIKLLEKYSQGNLTLHWVKVYDKFHNEIKKKNAGSDLFFQIFNQKVEDKVF